MLTKADRNTRVMVNTPTRVLFILDRTIFLERVCRGAGKSWGEGERETESVGIPQTARARPPVHLSLASVRQGPPDGAPGVQASSLPRCTPTAGPAAQVLPLARGGSSWGLTVKAAGGKEEGKALSQPQQGAGRAGPAVWTLGATDRGAAEAAEGAWRVRSFSEGSCRPEDSGGPGVWREE